MLSFSAVWVYLLCWLYKCQRTAFPGQCLTLPWIGGTGGSMGGWNLRIHPAGSEGALERILPTASVARLAFLRVFVFPHVIVLVLDIIVAAAICLQQWTLSFLRSETISESSFCPYHRNCCALVLNQCFLSANRMSVSEYMRPSERILTS